MSVLRVVVGRARRLHARHKFAALGALGMLMVATPWVGVLREQAREIETILGAQAALDPVARAVDVQRALLAHRLPAGRVLRGQAGIEPERLERQRETERRIDELASTLQRGRLASALQENAAMREDWAELITRIVARTVSAERSDAAHQLLVEQALQIIDLVADALAIGPATGGAAAELRFTWRTLPELEAALLALESARLDADPATRKAALARLQVLTAQVQRRLGPAPAIGTVGENAVDAREPARQPARQAASQALADYAAAAAVAALAPPADAAPALEGKAAATLAALQRWADAERSVFAASLEAALARQDARRRGAQAALGASVALWLVALAWLWPRRPALARAEPMTEGAHRHTGGESAPATRHLLRRLQQPESDTETPTHY